jgi:hypothetical protein
VKIRAGFVSNSSSTSFLIISKDDLNKADFFELMGISPSSPIVDLFDQFYEDVLSSAKKVDFATADRSVPAEAWFDTGRLSEHMISKIREAKKQGLKAYFGRLDSDGDLIESFFCTDSFEVESERIYFNGLECVW